MKIEFDFKQMKKELIDISLKTKNKELFSALCQKDYKEYIAMFLGFRSLNEFSRVLGHFYSEEELEMWMTNFLSQEGTTESWINYAKTYLHPFIYEFAKNHVELYDIQKTNELKKWNKLSTLLDQGLPLRNIRMYVLNAFEKEIAYPFISFLNKQPS